MFTASCRALAHISWPDNALVFSGTEGGGTVSNALYDTYEVVACSPSECCMFEEIVDANGNNTYVKLSNSNLPSCENSMPSSAANTRVTTYDQYGQEFTFTATSVDYGPCIDNCNINTYNNAFIQTGIEQIQMNQNLLVTPTLVTDVIKVTSPIKIKGIKVFDSVGKLVRDDVYNGSDGYNLSTLPNGIYYLQVYFENKDVKSVKILKN